VAAALSRKSSAPRTTHSLPPVRCEPSRSPHELAEKLVAAA
jgi:hypothetical protein